MVGRIGWEAVSEKVFFTEQCEMVRKVHRTPSFQPSDILLLWSGCFFLFCKFWGVFPAVGMVWLTVYWKIQAWRTKQHKPPTNTNKTIYFLIHFSWNVQKCLVHKAFRNLTTLVDQLYKATYSAIICWKNLFALQQFVYTLRPPLHEVTLFAFVLTDI